MAAKQVAHPSVAERIAKWRQARTMTAPSSHASWCPAVDRPDPVGLLEGQDVTREPDLVPVRHGRMMVSPFTFYRGAGEEFDQSITDFSQAHADQNEQDYQQFVGAVRSGRLEAVEGV